MNFPTTLFLFESLKKIHRMSLLLPGILIPKNLHLKGMYVDFNVMLSAGLPILFQVNNAVICLRNNMSLLKKLSSPLPGQFTNTTLHTGQPDSSLTHALKLGSCCMFFPASFSSWFWLLHPAPQTTFHPSRSPLSVYETVVLGQSRGLPPLYVSYTKPLKLFENK